MELLVSVDSEELYFRGTVISYLFSLLKYIEKKNNLFHKGTS